MRVRHPPALIPIPIRALIAALACGAAPLSAQPVPDARDRMAPGAFVAARVEPARELSFGAIIASAEPLVVTLSPGAG
ncbi:hypothetical protein GVO57_03745 [Sphingomonas changnyeongensis]|uniref:Uncharacterized protein n=1 Tax=Sphingomonas changnyeongensis TaxID=2698679 RepID=A0A7Z2NV49_9SPHN|nr:hypothetical protein [Sphingomonas changnyeongensis]QHL90107.1 hypothetical protein GVO57_03745 [Sphingomonas changnyeongensis]